MRPEIRELLLATFADTETPSKVEAFLRLQMERLRRREKGWGPDPAPAARLDLRGAARQRAEARLAEVLDRAEALGAFLLTPWEEDYPGRLRGIAGPPPVLFGRGDRRVGLTRSVAVVGTRTPTRWGARTADRIAAVFAERGWTVVSGLAVGLDRHVHEATLRCRGRTVAVLAGGLDRITPATHRMLADRIVEQGGLLVSEQGFGVEPSPASRIRRDRIQSGMSLATIVVETELGGGAMHTARFAVEQGRPLFVPVPSDTSGFQSRGALQLLYRDRFAKPLEVPAGLDSLERELAKLAGD
jgi:DNA processing protein